MLLKISPFFALALATVCATGEFNVLTYPPSVVLKGHDHIKQCLLKEVYSAVLGFTTEHDSNWQGLYLLDPFNLADAIVTVCVDGVSNIGNLKGYSFPMRTDEDESDTFDSMARRIEDRYPYGNNQAVRIELALGQYALDGISIFSDVKETKPKKTLGGALKLSVEEDAQFLEEVGLLNDLVKKIDSLPPKTDANGDLFWFKVSGLHAVSDLHGENSTAVKEGTQLLRDAIENLRSAFTKYYAGKVLINVITSDSSHTRRARDVDGQKDTKTEFDKINLAGTYGEDYPVIFNIILWFGVIMVFTLLAIAMFIADMDPGRDSVIYRMTSTRMKKEN